MGRHCGLTEEEFWQSTLAKVMALYDFQTELDQRRDYFTAMTAAEVFNAAGYKDAKPLNANDLLKHRYPERARQTVTVTHNPAYGAVTSPGLRMGLGG